jgi:capsular exopolysaccharide synthesis family protein
MTTLPQTTGNRFPRTGGRTPAIPGAIQPGMPGAGQISLTPADVLRVLRQNFWLIAMFLLVSLAIGFAVNKFILEKNFKQFTAVGQLRLQSPTEIDPLNSGSSRGQYLANLAERQKTHATMLRQDVLWRQSFQNPESAIRKTNWFSGFATAGANGGPDVDRALSDLRKKFNVTVIPESELITVSMSAADPDDAVVVIREIVRKYLEREQVGSTVGQSDELNTLRAMRGRQETTISQLQRQISERQAALGADSMGNRLGSVGLLELQVGQLLGKRVEAMDALNRAEIAFQTIDQALTRGEMPGELAMAVDADPTLQNLQARSEEISTQLQALSLSLQPEHLSIRQARVQQDAINRRIEARRNEMRLTIGNGVRETRRAERDAAYAQVQLIDSQVKELQTRLGQLSTQAAELTTMIETRKVEQDRLSKIVERITTIEGNLSRRDQSRASIWWVAADDATGDFSIDKPKEMSFPILWQTMAFAGLIGTGLALGIAFLKELTDTSIRSPRDITRVGQLNLLGMIPHEQDDPEVAASDLNLIISQAPHSMIAEQFRHVRTRLQHAASLDTTRSLLITSPAAGDGKTTVACNIAAGLALNGRKILLVDANFRRPQLHTVFGLTNEAGFGNVLAQSASIESTVRKTNVPNLDVLTTGPRPANPTELLESQLLTEFIDRSLEEYDHVIFDTGPILLVSETVALAPRVDGVITVVKARANSRGLLQRLRDNLRQLKAEHLGVVLNGVRQQTGGYYGRNIKSYYAYQSNGN